jgi:hypothetical protein
MAAWVAWIPAALAALQLLGSLSQQKRANQEQGQANVNEGALRELMLAMSQLPDIQRSLPGFGQNFSFPDIQNPSINALDVLGGIGGVLSRAPLGGTPGVDFATSGTPHIFAPDRTVPTTGIPITPPSAGGGGTSPTFPSGLSRARVPGSQAGFTPFLNEADVRRLRAMILSEQRLQPQFTGQNARRSRS